MRPSDGRDPADVGLPVRPFLYTLDQIAALVDIQLPVFRTKYVFYDGRQPGARPHDRLLARNISPEGETPDWRVAEREVVRWMKSKGFRIYERGWAQT